MNYKAVWKPLPGSQSLSLSCPCNEILYEGTRGPGKTAAQLARFRRLVGLGYGSFWRGVIFDTEYKNLTDIITQSKRMYREKITDGADWFFMKLQTPLGVEFYKCRFTDIYEGPTLVAPIYWKFTATLELWKRPVLPDGWVDFPDFIINSDILDLAVNREWPEA